MTIATFKHNKSLLLMLKILSRDPLSIVGSIVVITLAGAVFAVIIFGDSIAPYNPNKIAISMSYLPPSLEHWMGTDNLGRDILSRVIVAAPIDVQIALATVGVSLLIGILLGSVSGYIGGPVDEIVMRITDIFLAFPSLVLAVAFAVALGPGVDHVIQATLIVWWPIYVRLARAQALSLRQTQFVEAARVAGLSELAIIRKHIIPNNISPLIIYATLDIGNVILYMSVMSYLGLGAQPPQAEWGRMVFEGQVYLFRAWWISIMPGLVIFIVALGFNLLGDAIRDALDPRYRK